MPDDDQADPSGRSDVTSGADAVPAGSPTAGAGGTEPRKSRISSQITVVTATGIVIAVLLAIGVVIAALDMKFQADQARWQQRQTCLEWYRLQAEYGLGPWYEKLPQAAADCGGEMTDEGDPMVPGGTAPALTEDEVPDTTTSVPTSSTTTTSLVVTPEVPTSEAGTGGP